MRKLSEAQEQKIATGVWRCQEFVEKKSNGGRVSAVLNLHFGDTAFLQHIRPVYPPVQANVRAPAQGLMQWQTAFGC